MVVYRPLRTIQRSMLANGRKPFQVVLHPGMLTNFIQDLLFAMERLSLNPYAIRRLGPSIDPIPFVLAPGIAENITTLSTEALYSAGRLFYADHSSKNNLTRTIKSPAACGAFFYIPYNGSFLPLAIETNFGGNLQDAMVAFSQAASSRSFDSAGLCQGMLFVWKALDPNVVSFSMAM